MTVVRKKVSDYFVQEIWGVDIGKLSTPKSIAVKVLRFLYVVTREFTEGHLTLRAMGLVYTTLLSLVPLLAVSFSVLKAFGVHNQIEPLLLNFLSPLGEKGHEITDNVIGFVENMKVGVLGTLGVSLLIYTVLSLIKKIEDSFTEIWQVKKPRSFARKFSDYMSVILIGPVLMFSAMGITATIMSSTVVRALIEIEPLGTVFFIAGKLVPYLFVCIAFTFVYSFIPNVKVHFSSALVGGLLAGFLWETVGWIFASFVVSSTKYTAIYSGFAIIIMFMIWLYLSWLILLVGAKVSYYHQYPQFLSVKKETLLLSNRLKEKLSVLIMVLISSNYYYNRQAWTLESLVSHLSLPVEPVQEVLGVLENKGFILKTGDTIPAYFPARDLETMKIREILSSVRSAEIIPFSVEHRFLSLPSVDRILDRVDHAIGDSLKEDSVKDLVLQENGD